VEKYIPQQLTKTDILKMKEESIRRSSRLKGNIATFSDLTNNFMVTPDGFIVEITPCPPLKLHKTVKVVISYRGYAIHTRVFSLALSRKLLFLALENSRL